MIKHIVISNVAGETVKGRVINTIGKPIAGALIDVWQTNDDGFYDVQQKGIQPD
jgi:hydroxyquinol 1,2-dioxygenase